MEGEVGDIAEIMMAVDLFKRRDSGLLSHLKRLNCVVQSNHIDHLKMCSIKHLERQFRKH